jgi:hypothetical protein
MLDIVWLQARHRDDLDKLVGRKSIIKVQVILFVWAKVKNRKKKKEILGSG